jgi:hypothetical protein
MLWCFALLTFFAPLLFKMYSVGFIMLSPHIYICTYTHAYIYIHIYTYFEAINQPSHRSFPLDPPTDFSICQHPLYFHESLLFCIIITVIIILGLKSPYMRKHDIWPFEFTFSCSNDSLQFYAFSCNHHIFIFLHSRIIHYCVYIYIHYIYIFIYTLCIYIYIHILCGFFFLLY